jgi:hypothetical protein
MGACLIAGVKLGAFGYPTPPPPTNLTPAESLSYEIPINKQFEQVSHSIRLPIIFIALIAMHSLNLPFNISCFSP